MGELGEEARDLDDGRDGDRAGMDFDNEDDDIKDRWSEDDIEEIYEY
jgi:hypothetical protein